MALVTPVATYASASPHPTLDRDAGERASYAWHQVSTGESPMMSVASNMVFDQARGQMTLFGGARSTFPSASDETWTFDGQSWTQHDFQRRPGRRYGHAMAYDPVHEEILVMGGQLSGPHTEMWAFDGQHWSKKPGVGDVPGRVIEPAMAWDPNLQQVVLFGGLSEVEGGLSQATWAWDGATWTKLDPVTSPSPRYQTTLAYDRREKLSSCSAAASTSATCPCRPTTPGPGTARRGRARRRRAHRHRDTCMR